MKIKYLINRTHLYFVIIPNMKHHEGCCLAIFYLSVLKSNFFM